MNVLCIGAGKEQYSFIKKAKELGLYVIAIDFDKDAISKQISDEFYNIDIKDENKVLELAKNKKIKMILPVPVGRYLTTTGFVNDKLGLKGITYNSASISTDKVKSNEIMSLNNIECAMQIVCKSKEDIIYGVSNLGYPCVCKPRHGSGSKGVFVINDDLELNKILDCVNFDDDILLETYLTGNEYGVDVVIVNGEITILSLRKKVLTVGEYRQEIGYIIEDMSSNKNYKKYIESINSICNVFGYDNCFIHMDIMIDGESLSVVELSGRPAGLDIISEFLPNAFNKDIYTLFINSIINHEKFYWDFKGINKNSYYMKFIDLENCIIKKIPDKKFYKDFRIIYSDIKCKADDKLGIIKSGYDLSERGYIIIKDKNEKGLLEKAERFMRKFKVV